MNTETKISAKSLFIAALSSTGQKFEEAEDTYVVLMNAPFGDAVSYLKMKFGFGDTYPGIIREFIAARAEHIRKVDNSFKEESPKDTFESTFGFAQRNGPKEIPKETTEEFVDRMRVDPPKPRTLIRGGTHTYALMEVPQEFYEFVRKAMTDAGYEHAISDRDNVLDMHGLALSPLPTNTMD